MCNPSKIAPLLTAASIAIAAACVLFALVAGGGSSWWTSGANFALMLIAAGVLVAAIGFVSGAAIEAAKCTMPGPCKTAGDRVFGGLVALQATLSAMAVAAVLAAFPASVPWFGTAIGIAFGVSAAAAGITLLFISVAFLPALDACIVASTGAARSTAVGVQMGFGAFAGLVLLVTGAGAAPTIGGVFAAAG
jgi:hypothetical protein